MTANLLDWDDELQTSPDEEYQALLNGLRRAQGFGLYFVQCSPFSGGKLIERVQANLTEKTIGVLKFEHAIADGNVFRRVSEFLANSPVEVLFIQGLENSLFDAEETKKRLAWSHEKTNAYTWREVPPILINLNQQRERFRDSFATCFVFLLPQYAINYIVHRAPDFFDWRSGKVNYAADLETLARESERILAEADYDAYCNWSDEERTSRIFEIQAIADEAETNAYARAELFFEQGLIFAAARDFFAAAACFDKASKLRTDYHEALYNKGRALYDLGDNAGAIACYDAALAIKPDKREALNNKGVALSNLDDNVGAIACYDDGLAFKPNDHEALFNKGNALSNLGDNVGAIACYDAALAIKPDDHEALYNKAFCCGLLDDAARAVEALRRAIELYPQCREMAKVGKGFDLIRHDERFRALVKEGRK